MTATSGGVERSARIVVDFIGGSAERTMTVNVDEALDDNTERHAYVGIEPSGSLRARAVRQLTAEEETICSLMSIESEDLAGAARGDHWERGGPVPGGSHHTRFSVLGVDDGDVELAISRDLHHNDGSSSQWRGTMHYDANAFVPSTITLNGNLSANDDPAAGRSVAMSIQLISDTFKH